jgi:hypothetical protein
MAKLLFFLCEDSSGHSGSDDLRSRFRVTFAAAMRKRQKTQPQFPNWEELLRFTEMELLPVRVQ